jgi:hypothetical protein
MMNMYALTSCVEDWNLPTNVKMGFHAACSPADKLPALNVSFAAFGERSGCSLAGMEGVNHVLAVGDMQVLLPRCHISPIRSSCITPAS